MARRLWVYYTIVAGGVVAGVAGAVMATPASGVSAVVAARAAFVDRVNIRIAVKDDQRGNDVTVVQDAEDTIIQQIVFAPNGQTGWHSHPGPTVGLVKSGQLTFFSEDDPTCAGRTLSAGQAWVEPAGHVHLARNPSASQPTEVWVTNFDVPADGGSFRIDEAAPGTCSF
jgi:quercetin dioxygenase-like cupin family protein